MKGGHIFRGVIGRKGLRESTRAQFGQQLGVSCRRQANNEIGRLFHELQELANEKSIVQVSAFRSF